MMRLPHLSLLPKILLSTSVSLALLFAVTGWIVQRHVVSSTARSLEEEVKASFQAYKSLWQSRAERLASVSLIISGMSDVRAAFGTRDEATIRDTASELWSRISDENALFLVADPEGRIVASLGGVPFAAAGKPWPVVRAAEAKFPKQTSGFLLDSGRLFQIVITPVYVGSPRGPVLLNVLIAGFEVSQAVARQLKESTGGSEFLFSSGGRVLASTLGPAESRQVPGSHAARNNTLRLSGGALYAPLVTPLPGIDGRPVGELWILRSFAAARQRISALRRDMLLISLVAILAGLGLTSLMARRIVEPVRRLDQAAAEVSRQNFQHRVRVDSHDELGRLAKTFNHMCASIQSARDELVRQERISTIGRLSGSIVHDLRNPLAAIYGGSEMLVDSDLSPSQIKRLAGNIYRASRRIQAMLQDLVNISRGAGGAVEVCRLDEIVGAAREICAGPAESQRVEIHTAIPEGMEVVVERARVERVFANLIANAIEAMPLGGQVRIEAMREQDRAFIEVADTGPGVPPEIRDRLFQPFVTAGKKNGMGLGLALARQTVLDQRGDLWLEPGGPGARFRLRLPLAGAQMGTGEAAGAAAANEDRV